MRPVETAEMVAVLKKLINGVVWTCAEIDRRRIVLKAIIDRLTKDAA